ncbi:MAG: sialate O-acetylesterase, partial [Paludibacter sp.]
MAAQAIDHADNNQLKTIANSNSTHYKVFILSGQSNAVGMAPSSDFPTDYQTEQTNVQIWAGMQVDASLTNQWINVKPGFGSVLTNSGSELSFAKEISKRFPNEHIRIIKGAWAATSMVDYWLSPSAGTPAKQDFYHLLINSTIKPALNNITANGDSYELAGFLWMQGESDANAQASANIYESNLSNFINDIRKDLNVEKMPFVIAKIDVVPSWPFNAIVRQAEDNVASKLQSVGIFDTHGFETDGVHYLAAGYVKMGIQFANQYINVAPKVYVSQIWDDAILNDLRLIGILKKYNAKATFAIDAGDLTEVRQPQAWVVNGTAFGKVSISDIKTIYTDFEVANHGLTHQALPTLTESERTKQIVDSKKLLESWLNRPIDGFVYPGCPYDAASENSVKNAGHSWARTCENTPDFCSNTNAFEFRTTVPFNAANFWTEFNRIKATGGVFTFWG